jgi:hypothetical protein
MTWINRSNKSRNDGADFCGHRNAVEHAPIVRIVNHDLRVRRCRRDLRAAVPPGFACGGAAGLANHALPAIGVCCVAP